MGVRKKSIKVSILSLTYNHEKYIRKCLDGFLMQETNFEYEILIHDDASTDKTQSIIREYQEKYPGKIHTVFQKENQHSKGGRSFFVRFLFPKAKGKYIALCEGDDYWTDPKKLQRQVDLMESHPEYGLCFHPVRIVFENAEEKDSVYPSLSTDRKFGVVELLKQNYIQTNSVMYRRQNYENMNLNVTPVDWYLHLYHAQFGEVGFIDEVMSVYRRHAGGLWWQTSKEGDLDEIWKKHGIGHMVLYVELLKMFGADPKKRAAIDENVAGTVDALNRVDSKYNMDLLQTYVKRFPEQNQEFALSLCRTMTGDHSNIENMIAELDQLRQIYGDTREELDKILSSRRYRYVDKAADMKNRFTHRNN